MRLPYLGSGGRDIRGFHNDTCAHLMGVAVHRRHMRVLAVGGRPAVGVVADERGWVPRAGDPEVGFVRADERGHARKRARGNPENCCAVVPLPDLADALSVKTGQKEKIKKIKKKSGKPHSTKGFGYILINAVVNCAGLHCKCNTKNTTKLNQHLCDPVKI